ncbi:hypothetical protein [Actibacterium sp. 188UL27-1]|uniref:hypothetical protein n=1 Tax=Actibacterium sp. 188UL27-1 TaxID=2786961 RepID=UPI00195D6CB9|nr:hypothetical protein [Actibacterium sp. 188UL27-1]MBM7068314.1 hypothetical protein [Actibacterium sp. 188UL27-1]
MTADLYLLVPIRHPAMVSDKDHQYRCLEALFGSLAGQSDPRYVLRVICDRSQVLPPLPAQGQRVDVDIPPPVKPSEQDREQEVLNPFRVDKGRRLLAGLDGVPPEAFVMNVDDDDLLHSDVVRTIQAGSDSTDGWVIDRGYVWFDGSSDIFEADGLHLACGTTIAVRAKHFKFSDQSALEDDILIELAGHRDWFALLNSDGLSYERVPFRGVIYRRGHANSMQTRLLPTADPTAPIWTWTGLQSRLPNGMRLRIKRFLHARRNAGVGPADALLYHWDRPHAFSGDLYRTMTGGKLEAQDSAA